MPGCGSRSFFLRRLLRIPLLACNKWVGGRGVRRDLQGKETTMDRIGLTFEEFAELKVRPRAGADASAAIVERGDSGLPDRRGDEPQAPGLSRRPLPGRSGGPPAIRRYIVGLLATFETHSGPHRAATTPGKPNSSPQLRRTTIPATSRMKMARSPLFQQPLRNLFLPNPACRPPRYPDPKARVPWIAAPPQPRGHDRRDGFRETIRALALKQRVVAPLRSAPHGTGPSVFGS